jgi:hypothetical protein
VHASSARPALTAGTRSGGHGGRWVGGHEGDDTLKWFLDPTLGYDAAMKRLFCWRCQAVMPMLDDEEWESIVTVAGRAIDRLEAILDGYNALTGESETNPNTPWNHRISLYGPPCRLCGKPLRSPKATRCVACGSPA